jgi:hypothetical protein
LSEICLLTPLNGPKWPKNHPKTLKNTKKHLKIGQKWPKTPQKHLKTRQKRLKITIKTRRVSEEKDRRSRLAAMAKLNLAHLEARRQEELGRQQQAVVMDREKQVRGVARGVAVV